MHFHDEATRELAHIRAMVLRLEQLVHNGAPLWGTVVTSPDYWRARLRAAASLAPQLGPQVGALLAQLDAIDADLRRRAQERAG